jgi:hypothetical protein
MWFLVNFLGALSVVESGKCLLYEKMQKFQAPWTPGRSPPADAEGEASPALFRRRQTRFAGLRVNRPVMRYPIRHLNHSKP